MIVRRERPGDVAVARQIQVAAFRKDDTDPVEALLLDALRVCNGWLDRFSVVAEIDGLLAGHSVCTRGFIDGVAVLGLGPIAVRPDVQRAGVGSAMMHALIGAADASEEPLVALLGSPDYYRRFGFVAAMSMGVAPPDPSWGDYFQMRTLSAYRDSIAGTFDYASPFSDLP